MVTTAKTLTVVTTSDLYEFAWAMGNFLFA
jgi:hypothetical protein